MHLEDIEHGCKETSFQRTGQIIHFNLAHVLGLRLRSGSGSERCADLVSLYRERTNAKPPRRTNHRCRYRQDRWN